MRSSRKSSTIPLNGRALPLLTDALARLWPSCSVVTLKRIQPHTGPRAASLEDSRTEPTEFTRDGGREAQSSLQAAMLALAEVDEDGRIRRRRVPKKELPQAADAALEQFVAARLLVAFEEEGVKYVDVAHEALFAGWPLYARWLADAEAHLKLSRRLEQDAREWVNSGESSLHLWTGERLAAGQTMLEDARFAADHPARRFLAVSIANDRRMQEREANLIAARIDAEHLRLPVASLLAAAAAVKRYGPTPQLERAIRSALDSFPEIAVCNHEEALLSACLDPPGERAVTCGYDGVIGVFDAATGERLHRIRAHDKAVIAISVHRQGERILSASRDSRAMIWSLSTGELLMELSGHRAIIGEAKFDDSGTIVATASRDKTARVFDANSGQVLFLFEHPDQVISVNIDPEGRRIVTGCLDKRARVFALDDDSPRPILEVEAVGKARWHPKLPYIAIVDQADCMQIVAVEEAGAGRPVQSAAVPSDGGRGSGVTLPPTLGTAGVRDLRFDQAGTRLLAVCTDATAKVFDLRDGRRISELTGHEGDMVSARFAPGGAQVLTAARDGVARLYDVESGILIREFRGHADALEGASFNEGGNRIVTASADGFARVYHARSSPRGVVLAEHGAPCSALAVSVTGTRAVAATTDGWLLVVELGDQPQARSFRSHDRQIQGLDVSLDGCRAVTQPQYESAKVIDLATGAVLFEAHGVEPIARPDSCGTAT